jgi:hypothetical protein
MAFIRSYGITPITWPPYSPELNPIKHLWWHSKKRMHEVRLRRWLRPGRLDLPDEFPSTLAGLCKDADLRTQRLGMTPHHGPQSLEIG